jgi:hypothetical protein
MPDEFASKDDPELREVYEPPMMSEVGEYSDLTTGCGYNFYEAPAQHSNCSNW